MIVMVAEAGASGDVWYVSGRSGWGGKTARDSFVEEVLAYVKTMPDDEHTPQQLELYEYESVNALCQPFETGSVLIAEIVYDYPGDWYVDRKDGEA